MRKSFTRLLSLVMLLTLFSSVVMASLAGDATKVLPIDPSTGTTKAWTKTTDKIYVIYPDVVQASTGSVRVTSGSSLVAVVPATDSRISYAKGDTVVIDLSASLTELTNYVVDIDASTFKTVATTPVNKSAETWTFTTGDYTAPVLTKTELVPPLSGTVSTATLKMTFTDASSGLIGSGNVSIYKADGNLWDMIPVSSGVFAVTGPTAGVYTYTLTLPASRVLEDNISYAATIDAGVVTDNGTRADSKKNAYGGLTDRTVYTFSSKDYTAPGYATGYPKKGTVTNIAASVLIKTVEAGKAYAVINSGAGATTAIAPATIKSTGTAVTVATAGAEYSIDFTGLSEGIQYYIHVVTENADGNLSAAEAQVPVKTSETTAPTLAGVEYFKGAVSKATASVASNVVKTTGPAANAYAASFGTGINDFSVPQDIDNIILTFSEDVAIGAGNIIIYKASDNLELLTIPASSLVVQTNKTKVKVPVSGLANNASYYISIPSTIIKDGSNNVYGGLSATTDFTFRTNDKVFPTFTYTPVEAASAVAVDKSIVITFDELVNPRVGFGDLSVAYNVTTAPVNPFEVLVNNTSVAFVSTKSEIGGKTVYTINPSADFPSSAVVTVKIKANTLGDIGDNKVETQGQGINFVVADVAAPTLTWNVVTKPADVAVATFNEAIRFIGGGEITNANVANLLVVKQTNASGVNIPYTATIDANKKVITITPVTPWTSEGVYYVAVSQDVEDVAGNDFGGVNRIYSPLTITDVTPATVDLSSVDGKTISTNPLVDPITLVFKEGASIEGRTLLFYNNTWNAYSLADMDQVIVLKEGSATGPDVAFSVTNASADNATFGISATLLGNKTYYLGIGASTKGADLNANVAKFVTFSTKFEGVPTVVSLSPLDGATQVAEASKLVITFDTKIEKASPYVSITVTDGTTPYTVLTGDVVVTDKVATITLPTLNKLVANKNYTVTVPSGVFVNVNSTNTNAAFAAGAWDFTTVDTQLAVSTIAPDNTTTAAIDTKLVLTFGEKVVKGTGSVTIRNADNDNLIETIDVLSSQVVLSNFDKTVTVTPSANKLAYATNYYVEVTAGALKDAVGNSMAAIEGKVVDAAVTDWTFSTADPALTITKVTPSKGSDKISNTSSIVVEFNRDIVAVSTANSVGYFEGVGSATAQSYYFGSSNVTISGKTLTITHADKVFPADTYIYLYLPVGVVKAANTSATLLNSLVNQTVGYPVATGTVDGPISFNTGDVNAPIPTFSPKDADVDVAVASPITITFDEEIFNTAGVAVNPTEASFGGGLFTITNTTTSSSVNFAGTISGKTVTLTPTSALAQWNNYTVTVLANVIKDSKGNLLTSAKTAAFRTLDATAPVISPFALTGADKKITVPALTITDAVGANNNKFYYLARVKSTDAAPTVEAIKAANAMTVALAAAGFDITGLAASTVYQVYYVADDSKGNTTTVAVLEATTMDTVAPLLASTTPATGAVDVDVVPTTLPNGNVVLKLTFNEDVAVGTGTITVRDYATQAIVLESTATTLLSTIALEPKSLNLTIPASAVSAPLKVYVEMAAGTVKDIIVLPFTNTANNFVGIFGKDALAFTTEDNELPTVVAASSTIGTVALDSSIKVVFSENVKAGTGKLVLYKSSVSLANAIQVFTAAEATFSGTTATVKPTANLVNGQAYIVDVEAGFAKDMSSNANANVDDVTVTFTGSSNLKPSVIVTPAGGATAIAAATLKATPYITATFSEDIYLTIAGYSKPLALLTQAELLAHVSLKDATGASVAISEVQKVGSTGITIVIGGTLKDQTNYTLTIDGFEDNTALVMDTKVVSYLTSDATAPLITFLPAAAATKVDPSATLTLTFSENVYDDVISANLNVFSYIDNTNVKNFVALKKGVTAGAFTTTGTDVEFTATISGKVITIVPTAKLESGFTYYYGLIRTVEDITTTQVVLNVDGTTYASFSAADYTAPVLTALNATNYKPFGAGAAANATMSVDFSEDVLVSTGSIVIRREDGTIFQTVSGTGLSISATDASVLKITHNNFEPVTNYFVEIGASVVVDKSNNPNVAYSDAISGWLFSTADTYALTATVTPTGTNTPRSTSLVMTFNKVPTGVTNKFINVYKADGTAISHTLAFGLIANGKAISIPVALEADQSYYARVEAGAFKDAATTPNEFAGIMDNSWSFSTVNDIAPKVVTLAPADNALTVDASTKTFTMTFDRNIAVGTGAISVRYAVDGVVFEDVDVTKAVVNAKTLTFNITKALTANTAFYVYIPLGAITNTEVTKDSYVGILNTYTWNFTTATDQTAPLLLTWDPKATLTTEKNHPTFVMTFDEDLVAGTGNLKVIKKDGTTPVLTIPITAAMVVGKTITVTYSVVAPATGLDQNTDYYVLVDQGIAKDAAGNLTAAITDVTKWTFKTGDGFVTPVVGPKDNSLVVKVYPNPFVNAVTIECTSELSKVVVSNIAGQVVKEVVNPGDNVQLDQLVSGVYFMSLYEGNTVIKTVKIVKR